MPTFEDLKLSKNILKALAEIGFEEPTPIQEQAIPAIKSGNDVLGIAQTGTGKTAAYIIPIINKLVRAEGEDPRALIIVPTRELSIQVGEDVDELIPFTDLRNVAVYGGIGWTRHADMIKPGVDIIVSTPGRLMELYHQNCLDFRKIKTLVIDEADRLLDMGFMPQIRAILEVLPAKRQNLLFSATFSDKVNKMAEEFLDIPTRIEISPSATTVENVAQCAYQLPNFRSKLNMVSFLLNNDADFSKVIVFCKTKETAEQVFKVIKRKSEGEKRILHSNKGQNTRINSINAFKNDEVRILISTDLSARGIDASKVSHVINFDIPQSYDNYVHRIGRTARAGLKGVAITLIDPTEIWHLKNIEKLIRMEIPILDVPAEIEIVPTEKRLNQTQLREIDRQRKIDDPEFQGAFHDKKKYNHESRKPSNKRVGKSKDVRKKR